jgi:hypothetical protein
VTTHDAARAEPETAAEAVRADGLLRVVGAGGHESAAALHAHHELERQEYHAVGADEEDGNRLHERLSMAKFPKKATPREGKRGKGKRERDWPFSVSPFPCSLYCVTSNSSPRSQTLFGNAIVCATLLHGFAGD